MWQAMSPEECRAKILNKAMVGLGTAEDQLIRVISQLNFGERREVKEAYQRMFNKDLIEHVRDETGDIFTSKDFQKALVCMLQAQRSKLTLTVFITYRIQCKATTNTFKVASWIPLHVFAAKTWHCSVEFLLHPAFGV